MRKHFSKTCFYWFWKEFFSQLGAFLNNVATFQPNNYQLNSLSNGETIEIISNAIKFCIDRNLCSSPSCLNWFFHFFSSRLTYHVVPFVIFYFILFFKIWPLRNESRIYIRHYSWQAMSRRLLFSISSFCFFFIFNEILFFRTYPPSFSFSTIAAREKRVVGSSQPIN